jgi:hypothetical protein
MQKCEGGQKNPEFLGFSWGFSNSFCIGAHGVQRRVNDVKQEVSSDIPAKVVYKGTGSIQTSSRF